MIKFLSICEEDMLFLFAIVVFAFLVVGIIGWIGFLASLLAWGILIILIRIYLLLKDKRREKDE